MKEVKSVVAAFVRNPQNGDQFLTVRRPADTTDLPNIWGLPAIVVGKSESREAAVRRLGIQKLNTKIDPSDFIGARVGDRGNHEVVLFDFEASLRGPEPSVVDAPILPHATKYVDQQWTSDLTILVEAAKRGSLCTQIILDRAGILY